MIAANVARFEPPVSLLDKVVVVPMKPLSRRLAALAVGVALFVARPVAAHADESAEDRARGHFVAGVNLLQDPGKPRYEEAYAEFKRAYELFPSYKILGNIAFAAMKLERDAEAIDAYTRYLAEARDLPHDERAQVERDLGVLKSGLATIVVESRPEGALVLDTRIPVQGEPITNAYGVLRGKTSLGVRRGHHVLKARFPDGAELLWELDVGGGESHVFERVEPPRPIASAPRTEAGPERVAAERPVPTSVYVAGGTTVALGAFAVVTGLLAMTTHSRFEDANDGSSPRRAEDLRSTGTTLNVVSDVLTVSTLVAAGITTYLYLSRPSVHRSATAGAGVGARASGASSVGFAF